MTAPRQHPSHIQRSTGKRASTDQLSMGVYDLLDALVHERLLPEATLDVVQDTRVGGVRFIQEILECKVCLTKPAIEVLREDIATVCASSSACIPHN